LPPTGPNAATISGHPSDHPTGHIPTDPEPEMKFLTQSYRGLSLFVSVNTDRLLVPILIVASLVLAGWLVSLIPAI
jgi:hypothetical protein